MPPDYAADGHLLNYVSTNLDTPPTTTDDCPRFTETRSWTENFNNGQIVTVTNSAPVADTYNLPGSISGTASRITVAMTNHPHGAYTKLYVGPSGWMEGLPIATEDFANGASGSERKRWTWNLWTQDDTNLGIILNPRVTESKVGDSANTKKTTTEYYPAGPNSPIALYGLVKAVNVYDADQTTVLKRVETDYNLDSVYTSRRIIGLPSETRVKGFENSALPQVAKTTFNYDEGNFSDSELQQSPSDVVQHETANYGAGFIAGRGNRTSATRHDVSGQTAAVTSSVKYNIMGATVAQITPWTSTSNRTVKFAYADAFNDSVGRTTYAYPTKVYDPAGNFSEAKYRFDIGANVWAKSPAPAGNTTGKETTRLYDSVGRLLRNTIVNTGAYVRNEYPANMIQSKSFATIVDANNSNSADTADEVYSESWTDGAGRVLKARTEHPGSAGGWSGTLAEYDVLGQLKRSTVPTEVNSAYEPAGDDYVRGWLWNQQEYDWKGRTTRTIPSDSNGNDGKDQLISYEGCGCAGGQVTTVQGELVPKDTNPNETARRTQKIYEDILGRAFKTEVMAWDGATVYTTTRQTFNGRDQAVLIRQYDGTDASTTFQDTIATFDGHGRLSTRRAPINEANTVTTWTYNGDDSIQTITDPRGAVTSFSYGNPLIAEKRPLLLGMSYAPPSTQPTYTSIPDTPDVSFLYDNAGNRTSMSDGSGSTSYTYDSLSRLTSETKTITGLSGNFTLSYAYQIGGKLKAITDPFGAAISYNDDKTAKTTSVTGTNFADVTTYASGIGYRAFGGVKSMTYGSGDNSTISLGYDDALRVNAYQATSSVLSDGFVRKASYEYFADGRTKKANNLIDSGLDQNYRFDALGRLTSSSTGQKLNSQNEMEEPFTQSIGYNAFGDMTGRTNEIWGTPTSFSASYTNSRKSGVEIYDKAGHIVDKTTSGNIYDRWKFDAAGRNIETTMRWWQAVPAPSIDQTQTITRTFDGDGLDVKRVDTNAWFHTFPGNNSGTAVKTEYYVRSSVLGGQTITELDENGAKKVTHIYTGKGRLAEQRIINGTAGVYWRHEDVVTGSYAKIGVNGQFGGDTEDSPTAVEYDALGGKIETEAPPDESINPANLMQFKFAGDNRRPENGCLWNGAPIPCTAIPGVIRDSGEATINVNVRAEGGWAAYHSLRTQVSVSRYDVYRIHDNESIEGNSRANAGEKWKMFGNKLGIHAGYFYVLVGSQFLNMIIRQTQQQTLQGEPAPLNDKERKELQEKIDSVKKKIEKDKCKAFLEQHGVSISDLTKALDTNRSYSGPRSTNISVEQAGLYPPNRRKQLEAMPPGQARDSGLGELSRSVSWWFEWNSSVRGAVGGGGIYYKAFTEETTLHESLHSSTGKNDVDLARQLDLKDDDGNFYTTRNDASLAITRALLKYDCVD